MVPGDEVVAEPVETLKIDRRRERGIGSLAQPRVGGEDGLVDLSELQRIPRRGVIGDHFEHDRLDVRLLAPVVGASLDDDLLAAVPLHQSIRAAADREIIEVGVEVAFRIDMLRKDVHVGEMNQLAGPRLPKPHLDGVVADHSGTRRIQVFE